jgi:hypothetical protein
MISVFFKRKNIVSAKKTNLKVRIISQLNGAKSYPNHGLAAFCNCMNHTALPDQIINAAWLLAHLT